MPQRQGEAVLDAINLAKLSPPQRDYALLGLLSVRDAQLSQESLKSIAEEVISCLEVRKLVREETLPLVIAAVVNLIERGLSTEAKKIIPFWQVSRPNDRHDPNMYSFLKLAALNTILGIERFDSENFGSKQRRDSKTTESSSFQEDYRLREIREEMRKQFPSFLCWAKAISGIEPQEIVSLIEESLSKWMGDTDRWWYKPQFQFTRIAELLLEAVLHLPDYHTDIVIQIISKSEKVLTGASNHGYDQYADILSQDTRYHAQAEKLVQDHRREVRPPAYRASEAVQSLLDLYPIAARVNRELAFDVFTDARLAASEWDGNIGGRAFALLKTAYRAQTEVGLTNSQVSGLAAVFEYMKRVAFEDMNLRFDEALRLIARVQPAFALDVLMKLEQSELLDYDDGIGPVGVGMMDAGHAPAQAIWGLSHSILLSEQVLNVFYEVLPQLLGSEEPVDAALKALAKYLRTGVRRDLRYRWAVEFIDWAQKQSQLEGHPVVHEMHDFVRKLEALGLGEGDDTSIVQSQNEDERSPLFTSTLSG